MPLHLKLTPSKTGLRGLSFSFALIAALALPFFGFVSYILFLLLSDGYQGLESFSTWLVLLTFILMTACLYILTKLSITHWRNTYITLPIISGTQGGLEMRLHLGKPKSVFVPWEAIVGIQQDYKLANSVPENLMIQMSKGYGAHIREHYGLIEGQIGHLRRNSLVRYPGNVFEGFQKTPGDEIARAAIQAGLHVERTKKAGGLKTLDQWILVSKK